MCIYIFYFYFFFIIIVPPGRKHTIIIIYYNEIYGRALHIIIYYIIIRRRWDRRACTDAALKCKQRSSAISATSSGWLPSNSSAPSILSTFIFFFPFRPTRVFLLIIIFYSFHNARGVFWLDSSASQS